MKKPLLLLLLLASLGLLQAQTTIHYVKEVATGLADGSNWDNASHDLQEIINNAQPGDSIFVASGTYQPLHMVFDGLTDRDKSFVLKKDVKLFGGFAGTEDGFNKRDLRLIINASILSGDLDELNVTGDNAYHVVISAGDVGTAELNGFVIKEGSATDINNSSISFNGQTIYRARGAGMYNSGSSPMITNVIIRDNAASSAGAGVANEGSAKAMFTNVAITGNAATGNGGGMFNNGSSPILTNVLISGNISSKGGGLFNGGGSQASPSMPTLTNVTIASNGANGNSGGGIFNDDNIYCNAIIRNSIIYGNSTGVLYQDISKTTYSLIQGFTNYDVDGNISGSRDPVFVQPFAPGLHSEGDYRIQSVSIAVNRGSNDYYNNDVIPDLSMIMTDLFGNSRIQKSKVDMGAFESPYEALVPEAGKVYVTETGSGDHSGSSWVNAMEDLQEAIHSPGVAQVWVAGGTYQPVNGTSFTMKNGVKIYGGFDGTEVNLAQRHLNNSDTSVLKGNSTTVISNDHNNLDTSAVLDGFKIIGSPGSTLTSGGIYNFFASPLLLNLTITQCNALTGAGIRNVSSSPILNNININNNGAMTLGGGILNENSSPILTNVVIKGNSASRGGGMANTNNSAPQLINVTISNNNTNNGGGGIYNATSSSLLTLTNCILWGNNSFDSGNELFNETGSFPVKLNYCIYRSGTENIVDGANNITAENCLNIDPEFMNAVTGDYRVTANSSALDAGTPDTAGLHLPVADIAGNARIYGNAIDIGAYEYKSIHPDATGILYVDNAVPASGDGSSWTNALTSFGEATMAADTINKTSFISAVQQIWVAKGIYRAASGKSFAMLPNVKIYGSFAGMESSLAGRSLASGDSSILKGNGNSVIRNVNNGLDASAILDGFIITGGHVTGADASGGGIYNKQVSPTLSHLIIKGNTADVGGGGIHNDQASPIINSVRITGNTAMTSGGGIANSSSTPALINVAIVGNKAAIGGGIFNYASNYTVTNTTVSGNIATGSGGGLYTQNSKVVFNNCILWGNNSGNVGNEIADVSFTAASIKLNYSLYRAGSDNIVDPRKYISAKNSITMSPEFVDSILGDYRLQLNSPAINTGNNDVLTSGDSLDLAGNPRVFNAIVDIGAFENQEPLALPVSVQSFTGQLRSGVANLHWQSGVENNFAKFELQKSGSAANGDDFIAIASIAAKGSNSVYIYTTPQSESAAYYRLKLINKDGSIAYNNRLVSLAQAEGEGIQNVLVYPNPARAYINISTASAGSVRIYDALGRLMKMQDLKSGVNRISIQNIGAGVYYGVINGQKIRFVKL